MTKELQCYLTKKFPKLYSDCVEKHPPTSIEFECDDGWFRIILWLSRYLQDYIDKQNEWSKKYPDQYKPVEQIKVLQVKEKFATLRFYTSGGNEHTDSIISFAEYISGFVCEMSGKTSDVGYNTKGWIKTIHSELSKNASDFTYVDDQELRDILSQQQSC
jgi:hypothetical protein